MRRIYRSDNCQSSIVDALRRAGCRIFRIDRPADLLVSRGGVLYLLDCGRERRGSKRDARQLQGFAEFGAQIVYTPEEALKAVGL